MPGTFGRLLHLGQQRLLPTPSRFGDGVAGRARFGGDGGGLDLGHLLGLEFLPGPLAALVVGIGGRDEEVWVEGSLPRSFDTGDPPLFPLLLNCCAMHVEATREGLDRGEQALLQADHEEARGALRPAGGRGEALLAHRAVLVEQARQHELRGIGGEAVDHDGCHVPPGEPALHGADVLLEAAHHHLVQRLLSHLDPAGEPARIEQLEERGKAARVAVVRGG